jgi:hypothetical protein
VNLEALHSSARFGTTLQENLTILIDLDYSAFGPTPKSVAAAVRHVCGILLPGESLPPLTTDNLYETVQEYYKKFKNDDSSGKAAQAFLCYFSSYFHEIRHVHDLLGSRSGQYVFYNSFRVSQNMPVLLNHLWDWQTANPSGRVPLPLAPWLHLVPELPADVGTVFKEWAKSTELFRQFYEVDRYSPGNIGVAHLLETSAVNVQLDFVHDTLGDEAVMELHRLIEVEGNSGLYLQVRKEIEEAFADVNYHGVGIGGIINYLIWIALNQTFAAADKEAMLSPVRYFEFLVEEIIYRLPRGGELSLNDLQTAVDEICDEWKLAPPREMRQQTVQAMTAHLKKLQAVASPERQSSARLLEARIKEYEAIHDVAEKRPEFMGQRLYVWALLYGQLPSVHVKVFFNGEAHDLMTKGVNIVSPEDWIESATWGGVLRLLTDGMGKTHPEFFEQICYRTLREGQPNHPALCFFNPILSGFSLT